MELERHSVERPSARGFRALATTRRAERQFAEAAQAIGRAEELAHAELARTLCERARISVEEDLNDAAMAAFEQARALAPDLWDPLLGLGSLALHRSNAAAAESYFRQALTLAKEVPILAGLGLALAAQGRSSEAIGFLDQALEIEPSAQTAIHGLVQAAFQSGEFATAERRVRAFLELHPGNLDLRFTLAGLCCQLGDLQAARDAVEQIEIFDPAYSGLVELKQKLEGSQLR